MSTSTPTHDKASRLFAALIAAQVLHSIEEYAYRLFDVLDSARIVSEALGFERPIGFAIVNVAFVLFGVWCWRARVRPWAGAALPLCWGWAILEIANSLAHIALAVMAGGYFPGVATAPLLLVLGVALAAVLPGLRNQPGIAR